MFPSALCIDDRGGVMLELKPTVLSACACSAVLFLVKSSTLMQEI